MEGEQVVHVDLAVKESVDHAMETRCSSDSDHDHGSHSISEDATMEADQVHVDSKQPEKEFVDEEENLASGHEVCVANATQEAVREEGSAKGVVGERGNKCAGERYLNKRVERMVEENKKLKRMIPELCEREVPKIRMMNSLSQRVEALEKAVSKRKTRKTNSCKGRYDL